MRQKIMSKQKNHSQKTAQTTLPKMRANAGGIDIGATQTFVAVPADRDSQTIRSFPTFTQDLYKLAAWLRQCGVDTVAMESTGVYWIPLFQILEEQGIEVFLVNAHHVRTVPGRKTDVSDCQWLQYLHSVGLLNASYRPTQQVCAVRSLLRHRVGLVQMAATHVNRMQKSMTQMNLQLHHVISDITGYSGLAIIDAILQGERDPDVLAQLCNNRIKASKSVIAKSLVGDYRREHLFTLKQSLQCYRQYQQLIDDCDAEIRALLAEFESKDCSIQGSKGSCENPLKTELHRLYGVDLTRIPGLGVETVQAIFGEVGRDFTKFRSASAFASWLTLCPNNKISGGKILSSHTKKTASRASSILRFAAQSLHHSKSALGNFYRRMRARLGAAKAITAAAHKIARIIFHLVTTHQEFDETRFQTDQHNYQKHQEAKLRARAKALGFQLLPI
jgi:transposase